MAKILSFDNKLMKIGNGLLGPAEAAPVSSDYKLKLESIEDMSAVGYMSPNVTSGYITGDGAGSLTQEQIDALNSDTALLLGQSYYEGYKQYYLVFTGVSSNAITFKYYTSSNQFKYTLYKIIDGVDTQISYGTLPREIYMTEYTISLT